MTYRVPPYQLRQSPSGLPRSSSPDQQKLVPLKRLLLIVVRTKHQTRLSKRVFDKAPAHDSIQMVHGRSLMYSLEDRKAHTLH